MRRFPLTAIFTAALLPFAHGLAMAQGTLRIGMTASDIPLTTGQTDNGGEGQRVMGYTVYDALINWDLSSATKPSGLVPGLALSWDLDPADAVPGGVDFDVIAGELGKVGQKLGGRGEIAFGHGPVEAHRLRAAGACRAGAEQGVLGRSAGAETGQDDSDPGARNQHPRGGFAVRSARLDRGAVAGRREIDPRGRLQDRHQRLSA